MKRVILPGPQQVAFEDVPLRPEDVSDGQFYAETEWSAVSIGSETAAYLGHPALRSGISYPRLVGYCNAARVRRVSGVVDGVRVGDRVLTHQSHQSAFIACSQDVLAVIPEPIPSDVASLTYLAQVGWDALQKGRCQRGECVAVLGLGVIGLSTVGVAAVLGARIVALGNSDVRLRKARELGAQVCLRSDDPELADQVEVATDGQGISLLVTTANSWDAWRVALDVPRRYGRIAVVGFPGRAEAPPSWNPLEPSRFYDKQLTIVAAGRAADLRGDAGQEWRTLQRNMQGLLQWIEQGQLPLERLLTHRVSWQEVGEIYALAGRKDKALIGAALQWHV